MTQLHGHPRDALLDTYVNGAFSQASSLPIAAHLETCSRCRAIHRRLLDLAGEAFLALPAERLDPNALVRAMDLALAMPQDVPTATGPNLVIADLDMPRAVADIGLNSRVWSENGHWTASVRTEPDRDWTACIHFAPAGRGVAARYGEGAAFIAVLQGGLSEGGLLYLVGDFLERIAGASVELRFSADIPCISLVAIQGPRSTEAQAVEPAI